MGLSAIGNDYRCRFLLRAIQAFFHRIRLCCKNKLMAVLLLALPIAEPQPHRPIWPLSRYHYGAYTVKGHIGPGNPRILRTTLCLPIGHMNQFAIIFDVGATFVPIAPRYQHGNTNQLVVISRSSSVLPKPALPPYDQWLLCLYGRSSVAKALAFHHLICDGSMEIKAHMIGTGANDTANRLRRSPSASPTSSTNMDPCIASTTASNWSASCILVKIFPLSCHRQLFYGLMGECRQIR